jgi:hypothetical protein
MNAPLDPSSQPASVPYPPCRPMTFGQALDRVFRILKAQWKTFFAIGSVPSAIYAGFFAVLALAVVVILQPWRHPDPARFTAQFVLFAGIMLLGEVGTLVAYALFQPAASYAALQADAGVEVTFRDAYSRAWSRFGRYLWLLILKSLIVAGPIMVFAAVIGGGMVLATLHGNGQSDPNVMFAVVPLMILLYTFSGIYMVAALIWLAFSYPACIDENLTAAASIRRSVKLTKGARVRILLLAAVIYAISYAAFLVIECVLGLVGAVAFVAGIALHLAMNPWGYIGAGIGGVCLLILLFFWMAVSTSAYATAFAVLYRNQRLCTEGTAPIGGQAVFQ